MNCKTHCLHYCDQEFLSESAIFLFNTFQNVFLPFIFFLAYYISLMYTLFTSAYIFCFLGVCKTHLTSLQFSTTRVHLWNAIYDLRGKVLCRSLSLTWRMSKHFLILFRASLSFSSMACLRFSQNV